MAYNFAKTCEVLLTDIPLVKATKGKYVFPVVNNTSAYNYAKVMDRLIDFTNPDAESKPMALMYHKLVGHTFKHILHKYKRSTLMTQQYKVWAVVDFYTFEGRYYNYVEYPMIEDLSALKKEIVLRTCAKIDVFDKYLDKGLDGLNKGALSDLRGYKNSEFKTDFEAVHPTWEALIEFITNMQENKSIGPTGKPIKKRK